MIPDMNIFSQSLLGCNLGGKIYGWKNPYSGKLLRGKNFAVLWLFAKVFSAKFGGEASFGAAQASSLQSAKVFSLESFPLQVIVTSFKTHYVSDFM